MNVEYVAASTALHHVELWQMSSLCAGNRAWLPSSLDLQVFLSSFFSLNVVEYWVLQLENPLMSKSHFSPHRSLGTKNIIRIEEWSTTLVDIHCLILFASDQPSTFLKTVCQTCMIIVWRHMEVYERTCYSKASSQWTVVLWRCHRVDKRQLRNLSGSQVTSLGHGCVPTVGCVVVIGPCWSVSLRGNPRPRISVSPSWWSPLGVQTKPAGSYVGYTSGAWLKRWRQVQFTVNTHRQGTEEVTYMCRPFLCSIQDMLG